MGIVTWPDPSGNQARDLGLIYARYIGVFFVVGGGVFVLEEWCALSFVGRLFCVIEWNFALIFEVSTYPGEEKGWPLTGLLFVGFVLIIHWGFCLWASLCC